MQSAAHLAPGCHRALAVALLVTLSGCASTFTVAFGEHARAAIAQPSLSCPDNSPKLGTKTTTTTEYDDKIGFKPQVESVTETTEPAPSGPAHESRGSSLGEAFVGFFKGIGAGIRQLLPW